MIKTETPGQPTDVKRLRISGECLRLAIQSMRIPPALICSLVQEYIPPGCWMKRSQESGGVESIWYILPIRAAVPCTDRQRSHALSTSGSNQMDPAQYIHLEDVDTDIRPSRIAVYSRHDSHIDRVRFFCIDFQDGRWQKLAEEPYNNISRLLHKRTVPDSISDLSIDVHFETLTVVHRCWGEALESFTKQLIAYVSTYGLTYVI